MHTSLIKRKTMTRFTTHRQGFHKAQAPLDGANRISQSLRNLPHPANAQLSYIQA